MKTFALSATGDTGLGDADGSAVSRWVIQFVGTGWTGSVLIQGRVRGSGAAYSTITYIDRADGSEAATAITADALIEVNASGLEINIDYTHTAGSVAVHAVPVIG